MSAGKYLSLEEVRHNPRLLGRFIKERIAARHGEGDGVRFEGTLTSMIRNSPPADQTSTAARDADCSGTQTRQGILPSASRKRAHASRE